jgi:hypothetical protein
VEPPPTAQDEFDRASVEIGDQLDVIEAAVDAGTADLADLGFWRLVGRIKRDRALIAIHADQVGRIDRAAFDAWVGRFRLPAGVGTAVLLLGALVGVAAAVAATAVGDEVWAGLLLLATGAIWTVALHSPAHHLVGWLAGIRFTDYFIGGPFPPRPGIKTDYATYLRADPSSRAWMHASGAIATKLAPFLALAWSPFTVAPLWAAAALVALGVLQIATDVLFSVKVGDWKKFRRERAVARSSRSAR